MRREPSNPESGRTCSSSRGDPLADIAVLQNPDNLMAIILAGRFHKRQI
jgi:hypothetical protein